MDTRHALALSLCIVTLGACDSADPVEDGPVAQTVFVSAKSISYVRTDPPSPEVGDEPRAVFRYVGTVPAACYTISSSRGRYERGAEESVDVDVTIEAVATALTCRLGETEIAPLDDAMSFPLPAGFERSTFNFRFDRRLDPPIVVTVTRPSP